VATEGEEIGLAVGLGLAAIALGYALTRGSVTTAPVNPGTASSGSSGSSGQSASPYGGGGSGSTPGSPYGSGGASGSSGGGQIPTGGPLPGQTTGTTPPPSPSTPPVQGAALRIAGVQVTQTGGFGFPGILVIVTIRNDGNQAGSANVTGNISSKGTPQAYLGTKNTGTVLPGGVVQVGLSAYYEGTSKLWVVPTQFWGVPLVANVSTDTGAAAQAGFQISTAAALFG
jgi:hypothetical protein